MNIYSMMMVSMHNDDSVIFNGILVPSLSLGQWSDQIDKIDTDMFVFEYIWLWKCGEFGLKFLPAHCPHVQQQTDTSFDM